MLDSVQNLKILSQWERFYYATEFYQMPCKLRDMTPEQAKIYYHTILCKNRDKLNTNVQRWRANNPEKTKDCQKRSSKKYHAAHRDERIAISSDYRKNHAPEIKQRLKTKRDADRDGYNKQQRDWKVAKKRKQFEELHNNLSALLSASPAPNNVKEFYISLFECAIIAKRHKTIATRFAKILDPRFWKNAAPDNINTSNDDKMEEICILGKQNISNNADDVYKLIQYQICFKPVLYEIYGQSLIKDLIKSARSKQMQNQGR